MLASNQYSTSKPKRPEVCGSPDQVYKFPSDKPKAYLINAIKAKTISAIGSTDTDGNTHFLFNPHVHCDLQGAPLLIIGNMSNNKGEFMLGFIDIDSLNNRFGYLQESAKIEDSQKSTEDLTEEHLEDTDQFKAKTGMRIGTFPLWIPFYYGQATPQGSIAEQGTVDAFAALGLGYKHWAEGCQDSHNNFNDLCTIINKISEKGADDMKKYLYPAGKKIVIPSNGVISTRNQADSSKYPEIAIEVKKFFLPSQPNAITPTGGAAGLATNIRVISATDLEKEAEAKQGLAKLSLSKICGTINFEEGTIENIKYPIYGQAFASVIESPRAAQPNRLATLMRTGFDDAKKYDPTSIWSSKVSLEAFPKTLMVNILNGNFQELPTCSINNEFNDMNMAALLPQNDTELIAQTNKFEDKARNERAADFTENQLTRPKTATAKIGSISSVEHIVNLCVNSVTMDGIFVDLKKMKKDENTDVVSRQVFMNIVMFIINPKFAQWFENSGGQVANKHTHMNLYAYLESAFCLLNKFATHFGNVNVFTSGRPPSDLEIGHLEDMVKCVKYAKLHFSKLFMLLSPDTTVPRIAQSAAPTEKSPASTKRKSKAKADESASDEESVAPPPRKKTKVLKRPKGVTSDAAKRDPTTMGLFHIKKGVSYDKAFPKDLSFAPCGPFTTQGHKCRDIKNCDRGHWFSVRKIPKESDITKLGDHFLETKSAWFDEKTWGVHCPAAYKALLGDAKGPKPGRA